MKQKICSFFVKNIYKKQENLSPYFCRVCLSFSFRIIYRLCSSVFSLIFCCTVNSGGENDKILIFHPKNSFFTINFLTTIEAKMNLAVKILGLDSGPEIESSDGGSKNLPNNRIISDIMH